MELRFWQEVLWALPWALAWVTTCVDAHLRSDSTWRSRPSRSTIPIGYERIYVPYKRVESSPPWEISPVEFPMPETKPIPVSIIHVHKKMSARQMQDLSDFLTIQHLQRTLPLGLR